MMPVTSEKAIAARLDQGNLHATATEVMQAYGPQVLGYLVAVLRDEDDAREVFSQFAEDLWKGLARFRRECTFRAWAFKLAWHAASRFLRDPYRQRGRRLITSDASRLAASVSNQSSYRPGGRSERMTKLRQALDPEEQTLLIMRLDKELPWEEVAHVLSGRGQPVSPAALRKRFERLKEKLALLAREQGLIS
jgi:RNA polymerase sigma-70 factor (ECF subfamily)